MTPKKPTFIIIGSSKCGTTALASILGAHPDCCMSDPKEVNFFLDYLDVHPNLNYEKGWQWYQQAFAHYNGEPVVGEASPLYAEKSCASSAPKRIYEFNSNMKLVYMVRHPLDRQTSAWKMHWSDGMNGEEHRGAVWALKGFDHWMRMQEGIRQWDGCCYYDQLAAYLEFFPRENILVSFLEDWKTEKSLEVGRIMSFLGLDPTRWPKNFQEAANRADDRTIDRPLLKAMRTHPITRSLVSRFPRAWRDWARNQVARTHAIPPKPYLSNETKAKFFRHVKPDAERLLQQWRKPVNYWSLEELVTLTQNLGSS